MSFSFSVYFLPLELWYTVNKIYDFNQRSQISVFPIYICDSKCEVKSKQFHLIFKVSFIHK